MDVLVLLLLLLLVVVVLMVANKVCCHVIRFAPFQPNNILDAINDLLFQVLWLKRQIFRVATFLLKFIELLAVPFVKLVLQVSRTGFDVSCDLAAERQEYNLLVLRIRVLFGILRLKLDQLCRILLREKVVDIARQTRGCPSLLSTTGLCPTTRATLRALQVRGRTLKKKAAPTGATVLAATPILGLALPVPEAAPASLKTKAPGGV